MNIYALIAAVLAALGLTQAKLNAVVLGQPISVPYLGIIAAVVALVLTALVLYLVRSILRDGGLLLRPRMVGA